MSGIPPPSALWAMCITSRLMELWATLFAGCGKAAFAFPYAVNGVVHKKMEGVNETENNLADIATLQSFDKETLSKVIERVYVYGADRVEIIWKTDDIFFSDDMPEKRKVINPAEMPLTNETPAGA